MADKNKNSETITENFSNILTSSKRPPIKLENERGKEWYKPILRNFSKEKFLQPYSRFRDKETSLAERLIKTIRNLLKKPVLPKDNADWVIELPSVNKKYNVTVHSSIEMSHIQASKKVKKSLFKSSRSKAKTETKIYNRTIISCS